MPTAPQTFPEATAGEMGPGDEADAAQPATAAGGQVATEAQTTTSGWFGGSVLRHVHYRNMLFAQFVSNIGGWMELFGMQWLIAQQTGSLKAVGYLTAAHLVPILVFGTAGGLLADRVNRKKLLITTQFALMLVAGVVALLSGLGFPGMGMDRALIAMAQWCGVSEQAAPVFTPLVVLSALNGIIAAFNMPAWQVLTPRLVPREELTKAITMNGLQFNMTRVIGPGLAGLCMGAWGPTPLFALNALSFLGVALTTMTTPDAPAPAPSPEGSHPWRQVTAAVRFILHNRGPLAVFFAMTLMSLLAAPLVRVLSLFVIDVFQPGKDQEEHVGGMLLTVQGLGAVLGGIALRYIPSWYPRHHFIPLSVFATGLTVTAFAATSTLWAGYIAMFACGFFWIWAFNQSWAALQHLVTDSMRGRVLALANVFCFGATAIGCVVLGWIGESLKHTWGWQAGLATQVSVAALSVPLMVAGMVMLFRRTPEVDGMTRAQVRATGLSVTEALFARSHRPANGEAAR